MIKLLDFILGKLDQTDPTAVMSTYIDMSKAFNRIDHNQFIEDLFYMDCPAWLLKILISYLTERHLEIHYHNAVSTRKHLPVGGPAGCVLGGILFVIKFNGALLRPEIPRNNNFTKSKENALTLKFFDDATTSSAINLKKSLIPDNKERERPLNYLEHCGFVLADESNSMQKNLDKLIEFTDANKMRINDTKTKVMIFNKTRKFQFPPELTIKGSQLEVVNEHKVLSLVVSSDLKWY